jgi:hypothetical protein
MKLDHLGNHLHEFGLLGFDIGPEKRLYLRRGGEQTIIKDRAEFIGDRLNPGEAALQDSKLGWRHADCQTTFALSVSRFPIRPGSKSTMIGVVVRTLTRLEHPPNASERYDPAPSKTNISTVVTEIDTPTLQALQGTDL